MCLQSSSTKKVRTVSSPGRIKAIGGQLTPSIETFASVGCPGWLPLWDRDDETPDGPTTRYRFGEEGDTGDEKHGDTGDEKHGDTGDEKHDTGDEKHSDTGSESQPAENENKPPADSGTWRRISV
jgi:hypothetical protein